LKYTLARLYLGGGLIYSLGGLSPQAHGWLRPCSEPPFIFIVELQYNAKSKYHKLMPWWFLV